MGPIGELKRKWSVVNVAPDHLKQINIQPEYEQA